MFLWTTTMNPAHTLISSGLFYVSEAGKASVSWPRSAAFHLREASIRRVWRRRRGSPRRRWPALSSPLSWRRCAPSSSAAPAAPLRSCLARSPSAAQSLPGPGWKAISQLPCFATPGRGMGMVGGGGQWTQLNVKKCFEKIIILKSPITFRMN